MSVLLLNLAATIRIFFFEMPWSRIEPVSAG